MVWIPENMDHRFYAIAIFVRDKNYNARNSFYLSNNVKHSQHATIFFNSYKNRGFITKTDHKDVLVGIGCKGQKV